MRLRRGHRWFGLALLWSCDHADPAEKTPADSAPEIESPGDTGPVDTAHPDSGLPADTAVDSGPVDSGPVDTGPVDTGPVDTGTPFHLDADLDATADLILVGEESEDAWWDMAVDGGGDFDADGQTDILVGMPGRKGGTVYVVDSSLRGLVDLGTVTTTLFGDFSTIEDRDFAGTGLAAVGDLDGNGVDDLVVGAPGRGAEGIGGGAYVVYGPGSGTIDLTESGGEIQSVSSDPDPYKSEDDGTGARVVAPGDFSGDGIPDLLVTSYCYALCQGAAFLFSGPVTGQRSVTSAEMTVYGDGIDWLGYYAASAGDTNGDGVPDILLNAVDTAVLFLGPASGAHTPNDADTVFEPQAGEYLYGAMTSAGDVNDDGYGDVAISNIEMADGATAGGGSWLFEGAFVPRVSTADAVAKFIGTTKYHYAGESISSGDFNGDGDWDLAIGVPSYPAGSVPGAAHVLFGPLSGTILLDDANAILRGDGVDQASAAMVTFDSLDDDGRDSLLIAGPGDTDGGAISAGKAWLVLGDSLR